MKSGSRALHSKCGRRSDYTLATCSTESRDRSRRLIQASAFHEHYRSRRQTTEDGGTTQGGIRCEKSLRASRGVHRLSPFPLTGRGSNLQPSG